MLCKQRHHVRFFAADPNDNDGRSGNLPAGTVVDKGVVHPFAFDFYLQSVETPYVAKSPFFLSAHQIFALLDQLLRVPHRAHGGLVGTARPTHYVVLKDEIGK